MSGPVPPGAGTSLLGAACPYFRAFKFLHLRVPHPRFLAPPCASRDVRRARGCHVEDFAVCLRMIEAINRHSCLHSPLDTHPSGLEKRSEQFDVIALFARPGDQRCANDDNGINPLGRLFRACSKCVRVRIFLSLSLHAMTYLEPPTALRRCDLCSRQRLRCNRERRLPSERGRHKTKGLGAALRMRRQPRCCSR